MRVLRAEAPESRATTRSRLPDRPDVFVSYSRKDKEFVLDRLVPRLSERDTDVWIDAEDIPPAADWRQTVLDGVAKSSAFAFVLSPDSLESAVCAEELRRAVDLGKRLIPVLRRDVAGAAVPDELQRPNWVLLRDGDDADTGWAKLVEALEVDLEWRETHTRLTVRAEEWERAGHDSSLLLRGSDLKAAEEWLAGQASHDEQATARQAEYILRSRAASSRRQRIAFGGVATALVVAVVLAIFALIQRSQAIEQARVAKSRELAATSLAIAERDPELSVLLAREASRKKPTAQAEDALRQSLQKWPERLAIDTGAPVDTAEFDPSDRVILNAARPRNRARFAPDGRQAIVAPGGDLAVTTPPVGDEATIWDLRSDRRIATLRHATPVSGASFSRDGRLLFTNSSFGKVWDTQTRRQVAEIRQDTGVVASALSDDHRLLATGDVEGGVRVYDAATGRLRRVLTGHHKRITAMDFGADGRLLLTGSADGTARVWEAARGSSATPLQRPGESVKATLLSPDRRTVAVAGDRGVALWSTRTGKLQTRLPGARRDLETLAWSAGANAVAGGGQDGTAQVWHLAGDRSPTTLRGHTARVVDVALNPDGRYAATTSDDATFRTWDARSGRGLARAGPFPEGTVTVEFAAGGNVLVTQTGGGTFITDRRLNAATASLPSELGASVSADGRMLVTAVPGAVALRRANDGQEVMRLPADTLVYTAEISRDGRLLAATGAQGTAYVWDLGSRRRLLTIRHPEVFALTISPDGRWAAAGDKDGFVRVFELPSGERVTTLGDGGGDTVQDVAFAADSRSIVARTAGGTARIYPCDACRSQQQLVRLAEARAPRSLTRDERDRYLNEDGGR